MIKAGILQLKQSVNLMQPATQIHSKIKSQQLLHVKSTETVQGPNHRLPTEGPFIQYCTAMKGLNEIY